MPGLKDREVQTMAIPLYQLPTRDDPEYKHVKPSDSGFDGYSYQPGWKNMPLLAKIVGILVAASPFLLTLYVWLKG